MVITHDSFLTLHYRLGSSAGDIINTFGGKPATLTLGTGQLAPAVEAYLLGLTEGAHQTLEIPAGIAFGERNPTMQQWLARKELRQMGDPQETYAVGDVVHFPTPDGLHALATIGGAGIPASQPPIHNRPVPERRASVPARISGAVPARPGPRYPGPDTVPENRRGQRLPPSCKTYPHPFHKQGIL